MSSPKPFQNIGSIRRPAEHGPVELFTPPIGRARAPGLTTGRDVAEAAYYRFGGLVPGPIVSSGIAGLSLGSRRHFLGEEEDVPAQAAVPIIILVAIASGWLMAAGAQASERVALVIGNGTYQKVPALTNPGNDATDVAASLQRLGFTVTRLSDARYEDMRRALLDFARATRE